MSAVGFLLQKQAPTDSLQSTCSLFGKVPGRPASLVTKDSSLDVFQGNYGEILEGIISNSLFLEHQWTPLDGRIGNHRHRSSHQRCSVRKVVLTNFTKFTGLRPATLLKKRLWHRCFPVNFAKFLRTPFSQNTSGRLLL